MYTLPTLPYTYSALEPYIDARTMEIHYTKHHQGYVDKLNEALKDYPELQEIPLEQLLVTLDRIPVVIRTAVRNNGGGHFAHTLFWKILRAAPADGIDNLPGGVLAAALEKQFGSIAAFKEIFGKEARGFFGSGWTWLCVDKMLNLVIVSTPGHDVPMVHDLTPILVVDVWEHAYYLKYQNRRPDYIDSWWHVVNWDTVAELYVERTKNAVR